MNVSDDKLNEDAVSLHLLRELHEATLERSLNNTSQDDFNQLLMDGRSLVKSTQAPTWSIITSAADLGLELLELARELRLTTEILQKLDFRLLRLSTIPSRLVDMLADELLVPVEQVRSYFSLPPVVPAGIRFHALNGDPNIILESFEDALFDEDELTPEDRAFWLDSQC